MNISVSQHDLNPETLQPKPNQNRKSVRGKASVDAKAEEIAASEALLKATKGWGNVDEILINVNLSDSVVYMSNLSVDTLVLSPANLV